MVKKYLAKFFLLFIILFIVGAAMMFIKNETVVYDDGEMLILVKKPVVMGLSAAEVTEQEIENTLDVKHVRDIELLGVKVGSYEVTERTLGNGTKFLFESIENAAVVPLPIVSEVHGLDSGSFTTWNPDVVVHEHHPDFGMDPTVNPFGVVSYDGGEVLQSNIYKSKELVTEYPDGSESRLRELEQEVRNLQFVDDYILKDFWLNPGSIADSWLLVSDEKLFESEKVEDEWIDNALHNQTLQLNWLTAEGPYTKLPFSIEPGTQMGYGRAMGRFEDDVALSWNEETPEVFFETMVLNSRANLLLYLAEHDGTRWPTEYTSTWLKNAYSVTAPYVDTRFNEYVAFFLDETARMYEEDVEQEELAVTVYADYLLSRIDEGETIEAGSGLLIVDYFDEDPDTPKTHASLNHILGGLKILLAAYGDTNEKKYLEAAEQLVTGIEQFGEAEGGWIRDNGDLWYQARPDGTFSGDDYPQLTLVDLLETQKLLEQLEMERNKYFDELIQSKFAYLDSEDIELIEKVTVLME